MGKHTHNNTGNNMFGNMNFQQLASMMSGLSGSTPNNPAGEDGTIPNNNPMNTGGFDFNSLASMFGMSGNGMSMPNGGMAMNPQMNPMFTLLNMLMRSRNANNFNRGNINPAYYSKPQSAFASTDNIGMLKSLREVVDPSKAAFLDKIIKMYEDGEIKD